MALAVAGHGGRTLHIRANVVLLVVVAVLTAVHAIERRRERLPVIDL